jgi:hypothetical protein
MTAVPDRLRGAKSVVSPVRASASSPASSAKRKRPEGPVVIPNLHEPQDFAKWVKALRTAFRDICAAAHDQIAPLKQDDGAEAQRRGEVPALSSDPPQIATLSSVDSRYNVHAGSFSAGSLVIPKPTRCPAYFHREIMCCSRIVTGDFLDRRTR